MLVVLAILGVALGIVVARGAWHSDTIDVRAAADTVAQSFRSARAAAFRTDRPTIVRVDLRDGLLLPWQGSPQRLPRGVVVSPAGNADPAAGVARTLAFEFQPDGACGGGGVRLSEGHARRVVAVDFLSGLVSVGP